MEHPTVIATEVWQHKAHMQVMDVACHRPEVLGDVEVVQLV